MPRSRITRAARIDLQRIAGDFEGYPPRPII